MSKWSKTYSIWLDLLAPILLLGCGSWLLLWLEADIRWTEFFVEKTSSATANQEQEFVWGYAEKTPFRQLYYFGTWPALVASFLALLVLLIAPFVAVVHRFQKLALYWLCCLILAPGVVVNLILKDHYGRPRPRDCKRFGGEWDFERLWQPDWSSPGKSFSNGHASMGFLFLALYFWLRSRNPVAAKIAGAAAIGFGFLIGLARLAQGGHFPTDTLWSCGIVWLCCLLLARAFSLDKSPWSTVKKEGKRISPVRFFGFLLLSLGLLFVGLLAMPVKKEHTFALNADQRPVKASLFLAVEDSVHTIEFGQHGDFGTSQVTQGHGIWGSAVKGKVKFEPSEDGGKYEYKERVSGLFSELVYQTNTRLPAELTWLKLETVEEDVLAECALRLELCSAESLKILVAGNVDVLRLELGQQRLFLRSKQGQSWQEWNPEGALPNAGKVRLDLTQWSKREADFLTHSLFIERN